MRRKAKEQETRAREQGSKRAGEQENRRERGRDLDGIDADVGDAHKDRVVLRRRHWRFDNLRASG